VRPNVGRTFLGSFAGTLAITLLIYKGPPMMGAGVFGLRMGGIMSAFGSLTGYVIYGAVTGWIGGHAHPERIERTAIA